MIKSIIVIPARYHSSRFPGKPLVKIAGKTMLQRVYEIASTVIETVANTSAVVATDDLRIEEHALALGAQVVMTPESCKTGSDRALAACEQLDEKPDIVINLQGDAPLTPPSFVTAILQTLLADPTVEVATPIVNLSWDELDKFRERKKQLPFSGTTVTIDNDGNALWFSKQILPAIRKEQTHRERSAMSPVFRHVGLYGYRYSTLEKFVRLPEGKYEALEGLEQLRLLENGINIQTTLVDYQDLPSMAGVDTPEDAKKTEALLLAQKSRASIR